MRGDAIGTNPRVNVLVGGAGFVGTHLAKYLLMSNEAVLVLDKQRSYFSEPGHAKVQLPPLELRATTTFQFQEVLREYVPIGKRNRGGGNHPAISASYLAAIDHKVPPSIAAQSSGGGHNDEESLPEALEAGVVGSIIFGHALREWVINQALDRILFFSSIYGSVAPDQRMYGVTSDTNWKPAHYSASRSAIQGVARHFAALYGAYGCCSNCIVPGGIENGQDPEFVKRYSDRSMFGRMVRPDEVSSAAAFLLGPHSSGITGQAIHVDGGFTSW